MQFVQNIKITLTLSIVFAGLAGSYAQAPVIDQRNDVQVGVVEHLDSYLPDSISLTNEKGEHVFLSDLIDKPTVLNFVYYRCPGLCSPLMESVGSMIDRSDLNIGKDYQVFTISFDPSETIDLGVKKKDTYLKMLQNKKDEAKSGWQFFVSDSLSIARLTNAAGFKFKRNGNEFLHPASVVVVSADKKITRYLNGVNFLPFEWKMAMVEASKGKSGPTLNKVLNFCFAYDPKGQTYVVNFTKVGGAVILFFAFSLLMFLVLKPKKSQI